MNIIKSLSKLKLLFIHKINKTKDFTGAHSAEIFLLIGAFFIGLATYKLNIIAFYYIIGAMCAGAGIFIAKTK